MNGNQQRPDHLPDFGRPPLNEVVMGVQFAPVKGYHQLLAGRVWDLFRTEYPVAQEREALEPSFETFGPQRPAFLAAPFSFVQGAVHDRFWFMNAHGDELIQFQKDRLLHNWRKIPGADNEYPRFERMIDKFDRELKQLEQFFSSLAPQPLVISQCEISYVNHVEGSDGQAIIPSHWLKFVALDGIAHEGFVCSFREILMEANRPVGRFVCEASSALNANGKPIVVLSLTVRGAPRASTRKEALDFLRHGRDLIVTRFAELTTDRAHKVWERKQ